MPSSPSSNDHAAASGEFFRADLAAGALLRADGPRCTALTVDFIQSIHFTLLEQFGDTVQDVLYRSGFEWGLQEMLRLNQQLRAGGGASGELWERDANLVFASWWMPLQETGWGVVTFDHSRLARGIVVADLQHSIVASALEGADQPVCHYYAGLLGGGLSFFERAERHATEMQCRAMGHSSCKFIIGPGADVDAAEAARQQGVSAPDIVRRLG